MKNPFARHRLELTVSAVEPVRIRCRVTEPRPATVYGLDALRVALISVAAILEGNGVDPIEEIQRIKAQAAAR